MSPDYTASFDFSVSVLPCHESWREDRPKAAYLILSHTTGEKHVCLDTKSIIKIIEKALREKEEEEPILDDETSAYETMDPS